VAVAVAVVILAQHLAVRALLLLDYKNFIQILNYKK
jgi:hypothetical protein